jgi:hypothetical protein
MRGVAVAAIPSRPWQKYIEISNLGVEFLVACTAPT